MIVLFRHPGGTLIWSNGGRKGKRKFFLCRYFRNRRRRRTIIYWNLRTRRCGAWSPKSWGIYGSRELSASSHLRAFFLYLFNFLLRISSSSSSSSAPRLWWDISNGTWPQTGKTVCTGREKVTTASWVTSDRVRVRNIRLGTVFGVLIDALRQCCIFEGGACSFLGWKIGWTNTSWDGIQLIIFKNPMRTSQSLVFYFGCGPCASHTIRVTMVTVHYWLSTYGSVRSFQDHSLFLFLRKIRGNDEISVIIHTKQCEQQPQSFAVANIWVFGNLRTSRFSKKMLNSKFGARGAVWVR